MSDVKKFYNIYSLENEKVVIDIDGIIGSYWEGSEESKNTKAEIRNFLNDVKGKEAKTILVRISSPGGSVDHGVTIHDALKNHPANIEVEVFGMSASAATIISQAADPGKLRMSKNAFYLIHEAWMSASANKTELKQMAKTLETIDKVLVNIYQERTGGEASEIKELMSIDNGNGEWLDAEKALELGLIDEILEIETKKETIENHKAYQNKFAAMAGRKVLPHFKNTATTNSIEEVNSMENVKTFTAEEMEAAKKEVIENVKKHLNWIDKAENSTVLGNIENNANYADCVEKYSDERIAKAERKDREEDLKPENLGNINALNEMKVVGDEEKKEEDIYDYMEEAGYIKK